MVLELPLGVAEEVAEVGQLEQSLQKHHDCGNHSPCQLQVVEPASAVLPFEETVATALPLVEMPATVLQAAESAWKWLQDGVSVLMPGRLVRQI